MLPNYKLIGVLFKNEYKPFHKALLQFGAMIKNYIENRIELEINKLYTVMIKI